MSRLMWFAQKVLEDLGTWCGVCTTRDAKTVARRFEHEGIPFLTVRLPEFGKALEKALDRGSATPSAFSEIGFHCKQGLPVFMQGFLELVFDRESGVLLQDPDVTAIWAIRQFTLMFAKVVPPPNRARERAALLGYLECEQDVRATDRRADPVEMGRYRRIGAMLWGGVLDDVDLRVKAGELYPKHGPGATADKLLGNQKWNQREWTRRLEEGGLYLDTHLIPSWGHVNDLELVRILEPGEERPVRVVSVPKTYKTPRLIAIEPTSMQYMQQSLKAVLEEAVQADDIARRLVGTRSQTPNRRMAWRGSLYGELATLDLSEASDRVSYQHVRDLLFYKPEVLAAVDACRSRKADMGLEFGEIRLAKFASMGSALTFPMEGMVFMTIIFMGIERALSTRLTRKHIQSFLGQVRAYGDDLIVPARFAPSVVADLEAFGLKVNANKSFWTGKFRESCGREFFSGEDVSIVRVRQEFPTDRQHGGAVLAVISLRNQLYSAGLWGATAYLDDLLAGLKIPMPLVKATSPVQGRHSFLGYEIQDVCPDYQHPLVRGVMESSTIPVSRLDGVGALHKILASKRTVRDQPTIGGVLNDTSRHGGVTHELGQRWILNIRSLRSGTDPQRNVGVGLGSQRGRVLEYLISGSVVGQGRDSGLWFQALEQACERLPQSLAPDGDPTEGLEWSHDVGQVPATSAGMASRRVQTNGRGAYGLPRLEAMGTVDPFLDMLHGGPPTVDVEHLHRAGRPREVSTKSRSGRPW